MNSTKNRLRAEAVRILAVVIAAGLGQALAMDFNVPAGDWNVAENWTNPVMIPVSTSNAFVFGNRKVTISTSAEAAYLGFGKGTAGMGEIVDGASLTANEIFLADKNWAGGNGFVTQSGGTVTAGTLFMGQGAVACYTQQAGVVHLPSDYPGGLIIGRGGYSEYVMHEGVLSYKYMMTENGSSPMARFVQYGGIVTNDGASRIHLAFSQDTTNSLYCQYGGATYVGELMIGRNIGSRAAYIITNGVLRAGVIYSPMPNVGALGEMQISGSATIVVGVAYLGSYGNLSGGAATSVWNQTGGSVSNTGNMLIGYGANNHVINFTLAGGDLYAARILAGVGSAYTSGIVLNFTQMGGVLRTGQDIELPYGPTLNTIWSMQGGMVQTRDVMFGRAPGATGRWDIAGGTVNITNLYLGSDVGAETNNLTINLSGGLLVSRYTALGFGGQGTYTINQMGGTNLAVSELSLGRNSGADATYHISGGRLVVGTLSVGSTLGSVTNSVGRFHVIGSAPQVEAASYVQCAPDRGQSTLELTLDRNGGMRPIVVSGTATLNGILSVGLTNNVKFDPGTVVTVMTYNAKSGAFAQANLLDGLDCRVNVLAKMITLDKLRPSTLPETIITIR
ncbi:MAG: hypothetical protein PHR35_12330 [Kiritimatiellae bacterium]|nr:hypothetical protein [Kiritimatiellia bacterium]